MDLAATSAELLGSVIAGLVARVLSVGACSVCEIESLSVVMQPIMKMVVVMAIAMGLSVVLIFIRYSKYRNKVVKL